MRPFEHYIKGTAPPLFTAFDFIGFQNKRGDPKEKKNYLYFIIHNSDSERRVSFCILHG